MTAEPDITTASASKRWGEGHGLQLLVRGYCALKGHAWTIWRYQWPDYEEAQHRDIFEMERAFEFGPAPGEAVTWYRGCHRRCGTIQYTKLPMSHEQELPR